MDNYNQNSFNQNSFNQNNWNNPVQNGPEASEIAAKSFMTNVFSWMFGALIVTAFTAFAFSHISALSDLLFNTYLTQGGIVIRPTGLGFAIMFAPLVFILVMNFGFNKLSVPALVGLFFLFAATFGASLSTLFIQYELPVLTAAFAVTAGMFGTMAFMGYVTKADLSKFGAIMYMGLIGILIAIVVNWFMQSQGLDYLISFAGVAVFTGLTAYKVQALKMIGATNAGNGTSAAKLSIIGAMSLYITFLNLFLFILRLMGGNRR